MIEYTVKKSFSTLGKKRLLLAGDIVYGEKNRWGDLDIFSSKSRKYKGYINPSDIEKLLTIN